MKKLITIILLTATFNSMSDNMPAIKEFIPTPNPITPKPKDNRSEDMLRLFNAISEHETMGGKYLIGDNGKAKGYAHIHKVMVDDVNRILGSKVYGYEDRMSRDKSFEMFVVFQGHYNPEFNIKNGCMMWNAGADMQPFEKASAYYEKVMKFYKS